MATSDTIDHHTLTRLVEAGAVRGATVIGQPGGWGVVVQYGKTQRAVAAKRGPLRVWRRFETLASYLKDMGLDHYQVDAVNYAPLALMESNPKRPDAADRMRRAHEAAAYDEWFRGRVQASRDDPRPSIPNDEVKAEFAKRREALRAKATR
ncbi:type II toxin-antitoxin system RelB family antitoxin [Pollutimonas bauzanensis]|uniref:Stability determinant domain-containing protein n=1 Tax=Pollutimonas bauzanensis TaxID=658167 RepID=A0A1M5YKJ1_9BURK|nr:hypothetical protein [Pollutimonas bauzanensis]SHI12033.1 hypothetical protein SAMN04488135_109143 [Pollutimonas bauzanensis]